MGKKIMYCVLDTETLGGAAEPEGVYNLGAIILDRTGKRYATVNYLVAEHYNKILEKAYYAKKTFHRYGEMIAEGSISVVATEQEMINALDSLLSFFDVKYVMAYNTFFDLVKTSCADLIKNREFIDIYQMATEIIINRPSYKKYCVTNGFLTKRGNPKQGVEQVYGFLTNNPNFSEEHTAYSDAAQEMEIFLKCLKAHKKYSKNIHRCADFADKKSKK